MTETTIINALELDDKIIEALYLARVFALLNSYPKVDSLADGGASLIASFGKEEVSQEFPNGILFELSREELAFMETTTLRVLADIEQYRERFRELKDKIKELNLLMNND